MSYSKQTWWLTINEQSTENGGPQRPSHTELQLLQRTNNITNLPHSCDAPAGPWSCFNIATLDCGGPKIQSPRQGTSEIQTFTRYTCGCNIAAIVNTCDGPKWDRKPRCQSATYNNALFVWDVVNHSHQQTGAKLQQLPARMPSEFLTLQSSTQGLTSTADFLENILGQYGLSTSDVGRQCGCEGWLLSWLGSHTSARTESHRGTSEHTGFPEKDWQGEYLI